MSLKQITKTENKLNNTVQTAKTKLNRLKKKQLIIKEIKTDYFFDWLNS